MEGICSKTRDCIMDGTPLKHVEGGIGSQDYGGLFQCPACGKEYRVYKAPEWFGPGFDIVEDGR